MNHKKIDIVTVDGKIVRDVRVEYSYKFKLKIQDIETEIGLIYDKNGDLEAFVYNSNRDLFQSIFNNFNKLNIPRTIQEYFQQYSLEKDTTVSWVNAGGNSSQNAISNKISVPRKWLELMDINEDDRDIKMIFNGDSIIIEKKK